MERKIADQLTEITKIKTNYYRDFTEQHVKKIANRLKNKSSDNVICMNNGINKYLGIGDWYDNQFLGLLIMGPFLDNTDENLYDSHIMTSKQFGNLPILNENEISSMAGIIVRLFNGRSVEAKLIYDVSNQVYVVGSSQNISLTNESEINNRYLKQRQLINAIKRGDSDQADVLTSENPENYFGPFIDRVPNNPLRSAKNLGLAYNTMCRMGGEFGGLRPVYLNLISEKYAIKIEQSRSLTNIWQLVKLMAQEYCKLIQEYREKSYSRVVNETINYVHVRSAKNLTLKRIASDLNIDPFVLSRKFKSETGKALFDFVKEQRIEHAKLLLRRGNLTIGEISLEVGFNDQGYFSHCFKSVTKQTPSGYKKGM